MEEWIKEQQRRYLDEPRLKELTEVMKQIRKFVREKEYRKLTELVRRYRKSEDVITQVACLLSNSHLFPTPEKTVETDRSELMTALKNTYFMEKNGCRLADVNPEKADSVHGMLAMHTFMRDAYLKVYPESKQERPSPEEGKYSINSLVYWVTYVHNVVYSFYRSMIYCYINSTQRCAGSIVIDIIPTNGADKRKFFPFAPYFPVTNVIKRYFYPYFPAIIGIKGYSFPYFPYLSGIMKIKTALYSLFSRLDWHKTVVFPCLGEIYEGIRSLSWEIPVT